MAIPLKAPVAMLNAISKKAGLAIVDFNTIEVQAMPISRGDTLVGYSGTDSVRFGPAAWGKSYNITLKKLSSEAEPRDRHVIGEIRYHFLRDPESKSLNYVATFDVHMVTRPVPRWKWPEAVSAMIVWKGQWENRAISREKSQNAQKRNGSR